MENTGNKTAKQLKIAAILATAAIAYNLGSVKSEEQWVSSQGQLITKDIKQLDINNCKAIIKTEDNLKDKALCKKRFKM
jgi:hypothetical protein